jgi:hypothetical protein
MKLTIRIESEKSQYTRELTLHTEKPIHRKLWTELNKVVETLVPEDPLYEVPSELGVDFATCRGDKD